MIVYPHDMSPIEGSDMDLRALYGTLVGYAPMGHMNQVKAWATAHMPDMNPVPESGTLWLMNDGGTIRDLSGLSTYWKSYEELEQNARITVYIRGTESIQFILIHDTLLSLPTPEQFQRIAQVLRGRP